MRHSAIPENFEALLIFKIAAVCHRRFLEGSGYLETVKDGFVHLMFPPPQATRPSRLQL